MKDPMIAYDADNSEEREQITEAMNAYYDVYSDENIEKARASVKQANERLVRESLSLAKSGDYVGHMDFYKNLFDDFGEPVLTIIPTHRDDIDNAVALAKEYWPDAKVTGIVAAFPDGGSGVEVMFDIASQDENQ